MPDIIATEGFFRRRSGEQPVGSHTEAAPVADINGKRFTITGCQPIFVAALLIQGEGLHAVGVGVDHQIPPYPLLTIKIQFEVEIAVAGRLGENLHNKGRSPIDMSGRLRPADNCHIRPEHGVTRHNPINLHKHRRVATRRIDCNLEGRDRSREELRMPTERAWRHGDGHPFPQFPPAFPMPVIVNGVVRAIPWDRAHELIVGSV